MNIIKVIQNKNILCLVLFTFLMVAPSSIEAQKLRHRASRTSMSRPSANRPMANRPNMNRNRNIQRPPTTRNKTINGGHTLKRPTTRNRTTPTTREKIANRKPIANNRPKLDGKINKGSGNRINRDKGKGNININIDNSKNFNIRNTRVISSSRRYVRPPYIFGGFHFYAFRPYFYHPYRPFYWGPVWHPWGYFVTSLATTAIIISVQNQQYHYDQGVYYQQVDDGYSVVQAPVGATVQELPEQTQIVEVNETTNNYYYGGAFYEKNEDGYTVVPATAGTIVPALPEGGEEVRMGDQTYVKFGDVYYQPIQLDGVDMYEIVEIKEAD